MTKSRPSDDDHKTRISDDKGLTAGRVNDEKRAEGPTRRATPRRSSTPTIFRSILGDAVKKHGDSLDNAPDDVEKTKEARKLVALLVIPPLIVASLALITIAIVAMHIDLRPLLTGGRWWLTIAIMLGGPSTVVSTTLVKRRLSKARIAKKQDNPQAEQSN